ncbi:MAG TPA: heme ABC exporter ATP-binding protein CcmA [Kiloniellales bacterium]|nr:heme ABC exporter ATP-binding protein CcmA [Aestuariivirga sp.]
MELTAQGLQCERGGRIVFSGVGFALKAGELLLLTGPNGSGKSSLLRLIAGLNDPAAGRIALNGGHADLSIGQQSHYVAHQDAIKPALTVAENLEFWRGVLGGGDVKRALAALDLARLATYPAALLSAGQKRRLALARVALVARVLWLLDEPTTGLDKNSRLLLCRLMQAQLDAGGLIIAATHVPLGIEAQRQLDLGEPS